MLEEALETPARDSSEIRCRSRRRGDDVEDSCAAYLFYGDPEGRVEFPKLRFQPP